MENSFEKCDKTYKKSLEKCERNENLKMEDLEILMETLYSNCKDFKECDELYNKIRILSTNLQIKREEEINGGSNNK